MAATEVKEFTRVDLPWRNKESEVLRCVDGTQPPTCAAGNTLSTTDESTAIPFSPEFATPEQLRDEPVTTAADVYSWLWRTLS